MKPTALLINCARGAIVDDHTLASALANSEIGGAGLDVLGEEPPRNGNPLTAWVSESALATFSEQLIQNLECFVSGRPQNNLTKGLSEGGGTSTPTKVAGHE